MPCGAGLVLLTPLARAGRWVVSAVVPMKSLAVTFSWGWHGLRALSPVLWPILLWGAEPLICSCSFLLLSAVLFSPSLSPSSRLLSRFSPFFPAGGEVTPTPRVQTHPILWQPKTPSSLLPPSLPTLQRELRGP